MREFASTRSRASALSVPAKVLYTAFSALSIAGLLTSLALYDDVVRFGARTTPQELYENLIGYYQGTARRRMLEVTHDHLFSMPVFLLIAGHLFLLTSVTRRTKLFWIALGIAGTVLHLLAPWAVYWAGGAFAWVYPITGALLLVSLSVMTGFPVWDMWRPPGAAPEEET
jgi:hypothetical protein